MNKVDLSELFMMWICKTFNLKEDFEESDTKKIVYKNKDTEYKLVKDVDSLRFKFIRGRRNSVIVEYCFKDNIYVDSKFLDDWRLP